MISINVILQDNMQSDFMFLLLTFEMFLLFFVLSDRK